MLTSNTSLETGNILSSPPSGADLDLLIAQQKGVMAYTQHPISNFVSNHALLPSFHSFPVALSSVSVPHSIFEALSQQHWKDAMVEEMTVLKKNNTWEFVDLARGKKWLVENGFSLLNTRSMTHLKDMKLGWWPKGTLKPLTLIIWRQLHL